MKKFIRLIFSFLIIVILIPVILIAGYYLFVYLPYNDDIARLMENAVPEHKNPPQLAYKLAVASVGSDGIYRWVARNLLCEFGKHKTRMFYWHLNFAAWELLLQLHYTEQEIFVLWCNYIYADGKRGFKHIAEMRYGKKVSELTDREMATIIVLSYAPDSYKRRPKILHDKVNALLSKLESN